MKIFKTVQMLLMSLVFTASVMPTHVHGDIHEENHSHIDEEVDHGDHGHCHNRHDLGHDLGHSLEYTSKTGHFTSPDSTALSCCEHSLPHEHIVVNATSKLTPHSFSRILKEPLSDWETLFPPKNCTALIYANAYHLLQTTVRPERPTVLRI